MLDAVACEGSGISFVTKVHIVYTLSPRKRAVFGVFV